MTLNTTPFYVEQWFLITLGIVGTMIAGMLRGLWDEQLAKMKLKRRQKGEVQMIEGLRAIATVYAQMEIILRLEGVNRVLLLKVSNDGSQPIPGTKIYARAVEVKIANGTDKHHSRLQILDEYQKIEVDESYLTMVDQAYRTQEPYQFVVKDHMDCLLKSIYIEEKIHYSEIWHVHSDPEKWEKFMLSVATFSEDERYKDSEVRATIYNCVHRIRQTLESYR